MLRGWWTLGIVLAGCTWNPVTLAPNQTPTPARVRVVPREGKAFVLANPQVTSDSIIGQAEDSTRRAFPTADVKRLETYGVSTLTAVLVPIGLVAGVAWGLSEAKSN